jgi:uncharacterized protein YceK
MRNIAMALVVLLGLTGCRMTMTHHEKKVEKLNQEIQILRKEIRVEKLTNILELEEEK